MLAPRLGLEFARAIIPDEALRRLDFSAIFEYRHVSKDIYKAWSIDLNRIAAEVADSDLTDPNEAIRKLIATDLQPKVQEYEDQLVAIRDKLFGDVMKSVVTWEFPTVSLAYLTNMGFGVAVAAFVAGLKATVPHAIDYISAKRAARRKHAVSYLIGLRKR